MNDLIEKLKQLLNLADAKNSELEKREIALACEIKDVRERSESLRELEVVLTEREAKLSGIENIMALKTEQDRREKVITDKLAATEKEINARYDSLNKQEAKLKGKELELDALQKELSKQKDLLAEERKEFKRKVLKEIQKGIE